MPFKQEERLSKVYFNFFSFLQTFTTFVFVLVVKFVMAKHKSVARRERNRKKMEREEEQMKRFSEIAHDDLGKHCFIP